MSYEVTSYAMSFIGMKARHLEQGRTRTEIPEVWDMDHWRLFATVQASSSRSKGQIPREGGESCAGPRGAPGAS